MGVDKLSAARMMALRAELSRRSLLKRAAAGGIAMTAVASLLEACGGSSNAPAATSAATTSGSGGATATVAGSGAAASPASTSAPAATTSSAATPSAQGSPSASNSNVSQKFTIEPAKHQGGQLIWGTTSDAQTANSILSKDTTSGLIINMMFNGVMRTDPTNAQPIGDLAKSFDISPDGLKYSFVLTDGVKFHDGQPLTANDVKFTYALAMNNDTGSPRTGELVQRIASVDVADDSHFSVTLKTPVSSFLVSNMGYGILPQHILKDIAPADVAKSDFSTGKKGVTIGTGPFMFEEWVKDDHVTCSKNANYFKGAPNLDRWIMKVVPNATTLTQQLKTGEVDYGAIQPPDYTDMQKQANVTVTAYNTFTFTFYSYQLDTSKTTLFQDKAVRQALLYGLDRAAMSQAIYFGLATPAVGTMPVLSWAYNPDGITLKYPYDTKKAGDLLDGAGWKMGSDGIRAKGGQKLTINFWTSTASQQFVDDSTVMQQQWKKIGVDMKPNTEEWNAFIDRITKTHDFDIFLVGFSWGVDPDQTAMWATDSYPSGFNMGKYSNPQVDKLLQDGLATTDQAKRKQIYTQMQNILMDDLPNAVLFFTKSIGGVNKRVHNFFPNAVSITFNSEQWWVDA